MDNEQIRFVALITDIETKSLQQKESLWYSIDVDIETSRLCCPAMDIEQHSLIVITRISKQFHLVLVSIGTNPFSCINMDTGKSLNVLIRILKGVPSVVLKQILPNV